VEKDHIEKMFGNNSTENWNENATKVYKGKRKNVHAKRWKGSI